MYYNPLALDNLAHQRIVKTWTGDIKIQEEWNTILKLQILYLMVTEKKTLFFLEYWRRIILMIKQNTEISKDK